MNKKQVIAGALAAVMVIGNTRDYAYAASASENAKEEVIYIMTDAGGKVKSVDAVNIFGGGEVTDYGNYTDVKMLNTTDDIKLDGDKVVFSSSKDKVFYQGSMKNVQIPWNIAITYELNQQKITPEELAGKSGKVTIHIDIKENKQCDSSFYDNYALQAAVLLDTSKCKNIQADGATLANVGADKQISYTILPGKGLDAYISTDVTDFEMDAITINGLKLNLDINIDDKELMKQTDEIMDAAKELNKGALELSDGSSQLLEGGGSLKDGAVSLYEGADNLDGGINNLDKGVTSMQKALNKLNKQSQKLTSGSGKMLKSLTKLQTQLKPVTLSTTKLQQLTQSSASIKKGITDAYKGAVKLENSMSYDSYKAAMKTNGLDIDQLQQSNTEAIETLSAQIKGLSEQVEKLKSIPEFENNQEYQAQAAQLSAEISSLKNIVILLEGNNGAISGTSQYMSQTCKGAQELSQGLKELKMNYQKFDEAINSLTDELTTLAVNVSSLKTGVDQLVESYTTLDSGINDYTDGVASVVGAYKQIAYGTETLVDGSNQLLNGSKSLKKGTIELYDGIHSLNDGTGELHKGTQKFYDKTENLDDKIEDKIDEMLKPITGQEDETISFVSEKNTNVTSVQFVIKMAAVEKEKVVQDITSTSQKRSFWEKLVSLFKF